MANMIIRKLKNYFQAAGFSYKKIVSSYWTFPAALLLAVVILSSFGISGSSVGSYDGIVNNDTSKLGSLTTRPQAVRSDEWLVNTQMTVAQYNDGYSVINKALGNGQDMSVVLDVPYLEWSVLFKPQNWIFFIAPLNFAFAFKWWLLGASLAFSVYTLFLKLIPKQRIAAILLSVSVFLAPMVHWWYQSITILPLTLGFFIITLLLSIHSTTNLRYRILLLGLLSYAMTTFALVMYPPFQIPILLVVFFCYVAYCGVHLLTNKESLKQTLKALGQVAASGIVAGLLVGAFLLQHHAAVATISNTVYPGSRNIAAGDYSLRHINSGYLSSFGQSSIGATHYAELKGGSNQSEMSNFVYPVVPLLVWGMYLLVRKRPATDIRGYSLVAGSVFALVLFLSNLTLPYVDPLYKLLGLSLVPHNRLLIGIGFACTTLIIGGASLVDIQRPRLRWWLVASASIALIASYALLTKSVMDHNPGYITRPFIAGCAVVAVSMFITLLALGRLRLAFLALLGLSFVSSVFVNPPEQNLDEITSTPLALTIQSIVKTDPSAKWLSNSNITLENYAAANGAKTLSATYTYPQLDIWRSIDPAGKQQDIYNRYAHVQFAFDDSQAKPSFTLIAPDSFQVSLSPCNAFLESQNVQYIYGTTKLRSKCMVLIKTFTQEKATIYLYRRVSP